MVLCERLQEPRADLTPLLVLWKQQPTGSADCCSVAVAYNEWLYIKVEVEFMRVGPQFDVVDLVICFIVDPHIDGILGEDIAF